MSPMPPPGREPSLGEIYGKIAISREAIVGEEETRKRKIEKFVKFCKDIYKKFPDLGKDGKWTPEYKEAIDFLGWNLNAKEYTAAVTLTMIASVGVAAILGLILFISPVSAMLNEFTKVPMLTIMYIFGPLIGLALYVVNYVQKYPLNAVKMEQVKALTYVPEIMGYMIMSMKLVPNLEKAVEFAAGHGKGKIADDFKKLIWDVQLGIYNSLSEGLDDLAYRWGRVSEEFKSALMRVRAAVLEPTEAKRYALLDKTMDEILTSIQGKMEQYARDLQTPSTTLFYIGVLLPLILIIVLPIGSSFSGAPLANPVVLFVIYNLLLPGMAFIFALNILKSRPPTNDPPKIPDNYPGLPKKGTMRFKGQIIPIPALMAITLIVGLVFSFFFSTQGFPPRFIFGEEEPVQLIGYDLSMEEALDRDGKPLGYFDVGGERYQELLVELPEGTTEENVIAKLELEKQSYFSRPEFDVTPYNLIFGLLLTFGLIVFVYFHFTSVYKLKVQERIIKMEGEFKDSLYILASRMGENKPVEDALKHTISFLPQFEVSKELFSRTIDNISMLGMPLSTAVFDPNYGAMRHIPSTMIKGSMELLVDSVELGVNVAARTLISLSIQLENSAKVNETLRVLIGDVTGIMKSMGTFIAPMVLGITTVLQKIVIVTLSSVASSSLMEEQAAGNQISALSGPGAEMASAFSGDTSQLLNVSAVSSMATPTQFVLIVAIYIIELVIVMTYFTTMIQQDNKLLFQKNLAMSIPTALLMFVISMIASNFLVGGFLG